MKQFPVEDKTMTNSSTRAAHKKSNETHTEQI